MTDNDNTITLDQALTQERAVWAALVDGDAAADAALLTDDFLGVYPDGFSDRAGHCGQLHNGPTVGWYELNEARLMPCGPDHYLLAYRATYCRPGASISETMYVSSLWRREGAVWRNVFSQDTPVSQS